MVGVDDYFFEAVQEMDSKNQVSSLGVYIIGRQLVAMGP